MAHLDTPPTIQRNRPLGALRLGRGVARLFAARACFMLSGYLISMLLARRLGPTEYGEYGVILSILVWIEMLAGAGIAGAMAKLIPQHESQALVVEGTARTLLLFVSLGLFALCWFSAAVLARLFDIAAGETLFRLALIDLPLSAIYFSYQGALFGYRRFAIWGIGQIIYSQTKLLGILIVIILKPSVWGALLVNALATAGAISYLITKSPLTLALPSYASARSILRVAFPIALYLVTLQVLLSLDLWVLKGLWTGPADVIGIYVAAGNVAKLPLIVPTVLAAALFPSLSWALGRDDEGLARQYLRGVTRCALLVLLPTCALIACDGTAIMAVFYSGVYAEGGVYLSLQIIALSLFASFDIFFQALMAAGQLYQAAGILLALVPTALLLTWGFVREWGALGAAVSLVLTIALGTLCATVMVYRRFGPVLKVSTMMSTTLSTTVMVIVGIQLPWSGPWLPFKLVTLFALYAALLAVLGELSWRELRGIVVRPTGSSHPVPGDQA